MADDISLRLLKCLTNAAPDGISQFGYVPRKLWGVLAEPTESARQSYLAQQEALMKRDRNHVYARIVYLY